MLKLNEKIAEATPGNTPPGGLAGAAIFSPSACDRKPKSGLRSPSFENGRCPGGAAMQNGWKYNEHSLRRCLPIGCGFDFRSQIAHRWTCGQFFSPVAEPSVGSLIVIILKQRGVQDAPHFVFA